MRKLNPATTGCSVYVAPHIDRTAGSARLRQHGDRPKHPWSADDSPPGSNVLRSSKQQFYAAELIGDDGLGVQAYSHVDDTCRAWHDDFIVPCLIAGHSDAGNEPFFHSMPRRKTEGSSPAIAFPAPSAFSRSAASTALHNRDQTNG